MKVKRRRPHRRLGGGRPHSALNLAETHKVAVIAKGALGDSATGRAQGGIAAVLEEGDSFEAHVNDTIIAGAGLDEFASSSMSLKARREQSSI